MENQPIIRSNFTDLNGRTYEGVREVAFKKGEGCLNLGKFKEETIREDTFINGEDTFLYGVYIYQSFVNPNVGYRIHKEYAEYNYNEISDAQLIESLLKKQEQVKLAKFPKVLLH